VSHAPELGAQRGGPSPRRSWPEPHTQTRTGQMGTCPRDPAEPSSVCIGPVNRRTARVVSQALASNVAADPVVIGHGRKHERDQPGSRPSSSWPVRHLPEKTRRGSSTPLGLRCRNGSLPPPQAWWCATGRPRRAPRRTRQPRRRGGETRTSPWSGDVPGRSPRTSTIPRFGCAADLQAALSNQPGHIPRDGADLAGLGSG